MLRVTTMITMRKNNKQQWEENMATYLSDIMD
jgi:hypothetical protein